MYRHVFKRVLDIFLALLALPFFCVFYLILAPMIYATDKGPVFYAAPRLGKDGKIFQMLKFRSMKVDSPDIRNPDGSTFNGENDPRVTRIGRVLRKTSLDETPQVLNVLRGDMSVVGPRPFLATHFNGLDKLDEKSRKRLAVRPGITGYSQAFFRNSIGMNEKIEKDCYYVDHISFLLDLKILFRTARSVLKHENVYVKSTEK